jgi:hypothetical protein
MPLAPRLVPGYVKIYRDGINGIDDVSGSVPVRFATVDHELIHACNDFKAQKRGLIDHKVWIQRESVAEKRKKCDLATLSSWVAYYMKINDPLISNRPLLNCFSDLAKVVKLNKGSGRQSCQTGCAREQLEEAITMYQESRWLLINNVNFANLSFPPPICFTARSEFHPAGADVIECAIKYDPVFNRALSAALSCP